MLATTARKSQVSENIIYSLLMVLAVDTIDRLEIACTTRDFHV